MTILCDKFSGHPKGSVVIYRTFNFLWKLYRELNFTLFWFSFAYIEFTDKESVDNAVNLDESLFKGRQIKVPNLKLENASKVLVSVISRWTRSKLIFFFSQVNPKRTNRPGLSTTDRGSGRGRGRGRGFRGGFFNAYASYMPRPRGRAMYR